MWGEGWLLNKKRDFFQQMTLVGGSIANSLVPQLKKRYGPRNIHSTYSNRQIHTNYTELYNNHEYTIPQPSPTLPLPGDGSQNKIEGENTQMPTTVIA